MSCLLQTYLELWSWKENSKKVIPNAFTNFVTNSVLTYLGLENCDLEFVSKIRMQCRKSLGIVILIESIFQEKFHEIFEIVSKYLFR